MQQEIFLTLRTCGPLRLAAIASKMRKSPSGVLYNLQKMQKEGVVVCSDEKIYRLADTEEIEKSILRVFLKKTMSIGELLRADELKAYPQDKVKSLSNKLIITGRLERVTEWSTEEGRLDQLEKGYKLSFLGCSELKICYFCNEPVGEGLAVEGIVTEESWATVDYGLLLHPSCIANWMKNEYWTQADYYVLAPHCDLCGLPLNANDLIALIGYRNGVEFSELKPYLSSEEEQAFHNRPNDD
jgi:predicted transcriptional regulator